MKTLLETARTFISGDKSLPAMDESHPTCHKRFAKLGIPQTEEARRAYREMIVTAPGLGESISGAILYDETIRQQKKDGTPFVKVLVSASLSSRLSNRWVWPCWWMANIYAPWRAASATPTPT